MPKHPSSSRLPRLAILLLALLFASCQREEDLLAKGDAFVAVNKLEDAEIQYRRALQNEPNSVRVQARLGQVLQKQGKFREALGAYLTATQAEPSNQVIQKEFVDLLLDVFLASSRRPKAIYDQLLQTSKSIKAQDPKAFEALRVQGILALVEGRFTEAIPVLQEALEQRSDNEQVILALIEALYFDKRIAEAENLGASLLGRNPRSKDAYDRLYGIYVGTGRSAQALQVLERKITQLPGNSAALLQLARHYYTWDNNPAKGREQLDRLTANPKQYADGVLAASAFILEANQPAMAAAILEKGIARNDPPMVEMRKLLAECYKRLDQGPKALEQLRLAGKLSPSDDSIQLAEAILEVDELKKESIESALARLDRLKENGVSSGRVEYQRGRALLLLGKENEGLQALQESIRKQRSLLEPHFALAAYALNQGKTNDALRELDQIDLLAPENEKAVLFRAQALRLGRRHDEARMLLRQAAKLFPANKELVQEDALLNLESQRYTEALASFENLYRSGLTGSAVVAGIVESRLGLKQTASALAFLEKELNAKPDSAELKVLRAGLYAQTGDLSSAIAAFEKLYDPTHPQPLILQNLAPLYGRAGNFSQAAAAYRTLVPLARDKASAYTSWVSASIAAGDASQVVAACQAWVDEAKENWIALNNCAFALAETKAKLELAESYASRSLRLEPQQPNAKDTLGYVLIQRQKYGDAVKLYSSLCEQQPRNATFRYHYGLAHAGIGEKLEAKDHFEQALRNQPAQSLERNIRKALAAL